MKQQISAAILTKNEQDNISKAIKSVNFCTEVIIVDDYSSDNTTQITKKLKVKIYKHNLNGNYAQQRNFALKKAKNKWIFFLDADEIVTPQLAKSILKAVNNNNYEGYYIHRKDVFMGKSLNHGEWGNNWLLRLGKKNSGVWKRSVHEYWDIKGNVCKLNGSLLHYPHKTLRQFIKSINDRAHIHANELLNEKKDNFLEFRLITNPIGKFLRNMFVYKGILDATHGFVFAAMLSFQSFISWSHLWLKKHKQ